MIGIKTEVKKFADSLKAENLNYRILVFTDKDVIDFRDLNLTQLGAATTHAVWELSKKTGKTVDEVLHEIAFTVKVFEEEFEEDFKEEEKKMTKTKRNEIIETANEIIEDLKGICAVTVRDEALRAYIVTCCRKISQIAEIDDDENILPRPVIRDGNGKRIKDYTMRDFYLKLQEEIFETIMAFKYSDKNTVSEEIADVITVCISYLNAIGYDEEGRSEIFRRVNEKNEKRGYFEEGKTEKTATTKIFSEKEIKSCVERLQDLVRDRQSFLTGEADHDEVFLKDIHFLEMAMTLLELKGV